jgi:hypothetical protein
VVLHTAQIVGVENGDAERSHDVKAQPGDDPEFEHGPSKSLQAAPPDKRKKEDPPQNCEELHQYRVEHFNDRELSRDGPFVQ